MGFIPKFSRPFWIVLIVSILMWIFTKRWTSALIIIIVYIFLRILFNLVLLVTQHQRI